MNCLNKLIVNLFIIGSAFCFTASNVYALGQTTEMNLHGVGSSASYGYYHPPGSDPSYTWYFDDNYEYSIDATVESSHLDGAVWAETSAYSMHGYVDGSIASNGEVYNDTMDELFFTTSTGEAASLDFNFNLDLIVSMIDPTIPLQYYDAYMELSLYVWGVGLVDTKKFTFRTSVDMTDGEYDYFMDLYSTGGAFSGSPDQTFEMVNGAFDFSSPMTLSTAGWYGAESGTTDGLVDSGTYLPIFISIGAADGSGNMIIDYSNSFVIDGDNPYNAYNENNELLAPAAFTLSSPENFTDPAISPVPEPTTMLLFGTGLVGLVGSRIRKKKKQQ